MPRHLVVPIDLEALCANGETQAGHVFMPPLTEFENLPHQGRGQTESPFISERLMRAPFDVQNGSMERGVHLHWALPDAVMRGTVQDDTMRFSALPDRWLVLRLSFTDAGTQDRTRALVVDSRHLADRRTNPTDSRERGNRDSVAVLAAPSRPDPDLKLPHYAYLGRSGDLAWWSDQDPESPALDTLTAASFGRIELAAYYPNTRNVFGVRDDLADLGTDGKAPADRRRLSYVVIGWHRRIGDDPVAGKPRAKTLDALKWSVAGEGELGRAVYCGMVHSVVWDPNAAQTKPPEPLKVAIGNTTSEALAALLVNEVPGATPELEFQLNALLSGLLDQLGELGGKRKVTRQLHLQRFAAMPGGHLWYAKRKDGGQEVARNADGGDSSDLLPAGAKAVLTDLNENQEAVDRLAATLQDLRWRVFSDWYKYLYAKWPVETGSHPDPSGSAIMKFMNAVSLPDVEKAGAALGDAENKVAAARKLLMDIADTERVAEIARKATMGQVPTKLDAALELAVKPSSRYWRPRDPVLLLSGPDVQPAWRYGGDPLQDEKLLCRGSDSLVNGLKVAAGAVPGLAASGLDAADGGSPWPQGGEQVLPPELLEVAKALAFEAALLTPDWAAAKLSAKSGGTVAPGPIAAWIAKQTADGHADQIGYVGTLPSPVGWKAWQSPWLPILIHWQLEYRPLQAIPNAQPELSFDPALIVSRLSTEHGGLDADDADIALQLARTPLTAVASTLDGITFLTPHAGIAFRKRIDDYVRDHEKTPLKGLRDALTDKSIPILSQALSGFEDRFLMRRETLQLGVADPFDTATRTQDFIAAVRRQVQRNGAQKESKLGSLDVNALAPMPLEAFSPVRTGWLELTKLFIVDAFGQAKVYEKPRMIAAASLAAPDKSGPPVFLPPRLAQPAALRVHWIAAGSGKIQRGEKPVASPIFGWVVSNYLDESLHVYDANGAPIGSVNAIEERPPSGPTRRVLRLIPSPGHPRPLAQSDDQLQGFVNALLDKPADYLRDFLNVLIEADLTTQPARYAQNPQLPVLVGHPLALARAAAWLELMGAPATNESWGAVRRDVNDPHNDRTTNGYQAVEFPFLLGNVLDPDDGLIGFFIEGGEDRYKTFHIVGTDEGRAGFRHRQLDTLKVSATGKKLELTMLIDPRSEIHVTSGHMPASKLEIPSAMFRDSLSALAVTFLTAPVLTTTPGGQPLTMPLPLPGLTGEWKWARLESGGSPVLLDVATPRIDTQFGGAVHVQEGWLSARPKQ